MGWEERPGGLYYYRKERVDGKVRSVYVGTGPLAEAVAQLDISHALNREADRLELQADRLRCKELDEPIAAFAEAVRTLTAATLLAAGFHRSKRKWSHREKTGSALPAPSSHS